MLHHAQNGRRRRHTGLSRYKCSYEDLDWIYEWLSANQLLTISLFNIKLIFRRKDMSESIGESRDPQSSVIVWMRLARVYNKIIHTITEHLRQWDISLATFDLLIQVGAHEGLMQQ